MDISYALDQTYYRIKTMDIPYDAIMFIIIVQ